MIFTSAVFVALAASVSSAAAYRINFVNRCPYTVWPAVGKAPNGQPDNSVRWGSRLDGGQSASVDIDDHQIGIRAWGRTGCDGSGANCATGRCNGGLVCNDAGITSNCIVAEFGHGDNGPQWGGERTFWDLSRASLGSNSLPLNIDQRLQGPDGQTVTCTGGYCPNNECFLTPTDFGAVRNSGLGGTYTYTFCP